MLVIHSKIGEWLLLYYDQRRKHCGALPKICYFCYSLRFLVSIFAHLSLLFSTRNDKCGSRLSALAEEMFIRLLHVPEYPVLFLHSSLYSVHERPLCHAWVETMNRPTHTINHSKREGRRWFLEWRRSMIVTTSTYFVCCLCIESGALITPENLSLTFLDLVHHYSKVFWTDFCARLIFRLSSFKRDIPDPFLTYLRGDTSGLRWRCRSVVTRSRFLNNDGKRSFCP